MFKKILVGVIVLMMIGMWDSLEAKTKPNCEIGDAVFREGRYHYSVGGVDIPVGFWGHVGIYFTSNYSDRSGTIVEKEGEKVKINITESDLVGSVIQASGYKDMLPPEHKELDWESFEFFVYNLKYKGAENSGILDAEDRREIIWTAWQQKEAGCKFATGNPNRKIDGRSERQEDIKNPGKSFRCDGLVEYCYEQVYQGIDSAGNPCDNGGFFSSWEEKNCTINITSIWELIKKGPEIFNSLFIKEDTFYPMALKVRMMRAIIVHGPIAKGYPPQIKDFKLERQDGVEIKERNKVRVCNKITATFEYSLCKNYTGEIV